MKTFLQTTKVKSLCDLKQRQLILLDHDQSLGAALEILQNENILSAPVVNRELDGRFLGFMDVLDVAGYMLAMWRKLSANYEDRYFPGRELLESSKIKDVMNFSKMDYPVFVGEEETLEDLIKAFLDPACHHRLHRVAVVNKSGISNVLSQSDIIGFITSHLQLLPQNLLNSTVSEQGYLVRTPLMVRIDCPFIDALETLYKNRISGIALIDEQFKFCGNFSASDLRGISPDSFHFFTRSTLAFLSKGTETKVRDHISVSNTATFSEVILTLARNRVHRVYVTTEYGYPQGVISLIDIISRLSTD